MIATFATLSTPPAAHAQEATAPTETVRGFQAGDWVVRGRISGILPYDVSSQIEVIGGHVDVPRMVLPDLDISYFVTDQFAITGQFGALKTDIEISDSMVGDIDVGSIWAVPLVVSLAYHLAPQARFNPYLGAGVSVTWYTGAEPASRLVPEFSVETQVAPVIRAGVDYQMTENWFANLEVKQTFPPETVMENSGIKARTALKSLSVGLGLAYRF